jgi:hypothetical protein
VTTIMLDEADDDLARASITTSNNALVWDTGTQCEMAVRHGAHAERLRSRRRRPRNSLLQKARQLIIYEQGLLKIAKLSMNPIYRTGIKYLAVVLAT